MQDKRTRGRPPKGAEAQTSRIYLRAQETEKEQYEQAAKKADVPLANWIKDRLNKAARREIGD